MFSPSTNDASEASRTALSTAVYAQLSLRLESGGVHIYDAGGGPAVEGADAREMIFPEQIMAGIRVARKLAFSEAYPMVRWLDYLTNATNRTVRFEARLSHDLARGAAWTIMSSDDGDAFAEATDHWLMAAGESGSDRDPLFLGHVLQGEETRAPLTETADDAKPGRSRAVSPFAKPGWTYAVELAPGQTGILLTMMTAETRADRVAARVRALARLSAGALEGLNDQEKSLILNFSRCEIERAALASPTVRILQPEDGAMIEGLTQARIAAEDDGSLASILVEFVCSDGDYSGFWWTIFSDSTPRPSPADYAFSFPSPDCPCHSIVWAVRAWVQDNEGNMTVKVNHVQDGRIRMRITEPRAGAKVQGIVPIKISVSGIESPPPYPCDTGTTDLTITGPGYSRTESFRWALGGGGTDPLAVNYPWETTGLRPGTYLIRAKYRNGWKSDYERNDDITVFLSPSTLPQVRFIRPSDGQVVWGDVPVELEATFAEGVTKTTLLVDGLPLIEKTHSPPVSTTRLTADWDATSVELFSDHRLTGTAVDVFGQKGERTISVHVTGVAVALQGTRIKTGAGPGHHIGMLTIRASNPDSLPLAKFAVYRKAAGGDFAKIGELMADGRDEYVWADKALNPAAPATYAIVPLDDAGNRLGCSPDIVL